jgi:uncharacterized protein (TIGR02453 family)
MGNLSTFTGFPQDGIQFLADLAAHNERDWFEAHREVYQTMLLEPAQAFVMALGIRMQALSTSIRFDTRTDGSGVLMRIHRDTRFSPDKSPYKTNINGLFWEGSAKKTESPAFGFQIDATDMRLMAGIFKFPPAMLAAYRAAVVDDTSGTELEDALERVRRTSTYEIAGEHYKRVPSGYDPSHRRATLLRYDGLYVFSPRIPMMDMLTVELVDICYAHFQNMVPVDQWLVKMAKTK